MSERNGVFRLIVFNSITHMTSTLRFDIFSSQTFHLVLNNILLPRIKEFFFLNGVNIAPPLDLER